MGALFPLAVESSVNFVVPYFITEQHINRHTIAYCHSSISDIVRKINIEIAA